MEQNLKQLMDNSVRLVIPFPNSVSMSISGVLGPAKEGKWHVYGGPVDFVFPTEAIEKIEENIIRLKA
jgi:hypothetical protein